MSKKIIILSSSLIMLLSGSINAQTSPFDQSSNNNNNTNNQNSREGYITKREMKRYIDDLRMDLEFIVMQNSPSLNPTESNSSLLDNLGEDAKLKVIINGKELKRDNEKYSINGN